MKKRLSSLIKTLIPLFIFTLQAILLPAQKTAKYNYEGKYKLYQKSTGGIYKLNIYSDSLFEFIMDYQFDCTPAYVYYGKGKIKFIDTSKILLKFDSIPSLPSSHKIDSVKNEDEWIDIKIEVVDEENTRLDGLNLSWSKPIKKGRWRHTKFLNENFDKYIHFRLKKGHEINYLRIATEGYYDEDVDLRKVRLKDYHISVKLNPKSNIQSSSYISNKNLILQIKSSCEIYYDDIVLKKQDCP